MNFFEHQDVARQKTKWLVAIYAATLVAMIVAIHLVICLALTFYQMDKGTEQIERALHPSPGRFDTPERSSHEAPSFQAFSWRVDIFALATLGVLTVVGLGSAWKHYEMRAGGPAIAEWLGGRQIFYESNVPLERKIWNVVEEMAIASGTPMPSVYLLDQEKGINAFAAGSSVNDAVIGVSFGCVEELSRDELQGVIAHEFSHILHGDMRLNMRLIGILAGITLLSYIGYLAFRISWGAGSSRRSSSGKKGGGGIAAVIMLVGLAIYLIGSLGAFAAAIIQAAISRQREFLADASAVQYTRNPIGISGALRAIGASLTGSRIEHARAGEVRHMFFGQGIRTMFATHPPLTKRISRIESGWEDVRVDGIQDPVGGAAVGLAGVAGFAGGHPATSSSTPELSQPTKMPVFISLIFLNSIRGHVAGMIATFAIMISGTLLLGISTLLFDAGQIGPLAWILLIGMGGYLTYVPYGAVVFDRLIAATRFSGTAVFAIYIADSLGYSGSVILQLYKALLKPESTWIDFFRTMSYSLSVGGSILLALAAVYFVLKIQRAEEK